MLHRLSDALIAFGPWGVFLLALLDSAGIPLPSAMDALLVLVAWKTPNRAYFTALLATVGSTFGTIGLFWAARGGSRRWIKAVPEPDHPRKFRRWFSRYGLVTVFIPAFLPIPLPLKVFVISAGALHTKFGKFFAVVLLARIMRYFGEAYLGVQLGADAQGFLTHNALKLIGVALALTLGLFLAIWVNDRRRRHHLS